MSAKDLFLLDCDTYEEYLDTFVAVNDIRYLRNIIQVRQLIRLGYRSAGDVYTPEQFIKRKAAAYELVWPVKKSWVLYSEFMLSKDPFLRELALREKPNAQKLISTIIYMQFRKPTGFQVSGYLDYCDRLRQSNLEMHNCDDWRSIFRAKALLEPRKTDLSYYDELTGKANYKNSENYKVIHDVHNGLMFMHKGDHKMVCIDHSVKEYKDNSMRTVVHSKVYGYAVFYDHIVRKKH